MTIKEAPILNFSGKEKEVLLASFPQGVVALDVESTGLSPLTDRVIELSAVKILPKAMEIFDHLVNPGIPIPEAVIDIHGITEKMVENASPTFSIMPKFLDFIKNLPLIAHNAKYDLGFIVCSFHHLNLSWSDAPVYCSHILAKEVLKKTVTDKKLSTLVKHFNLPSFTSHRALADAAACLHVYAHCLLEMQGKHLDLTRKKSHLFNLKHFKGHDFTIPDSLQILLKKIPSREPVEIMYKAGSHRNKFRPLRPYSIFPLPQGNMLYAHCLLSDTYKSFYLHKIKAARDLTTQNKSLYTKFTKSTSEKKQRK